MKIEISSKVFRTMVRVVAAERPDFQYNALGSAGCHYDTRVMGDGSKSRCIIGEVLHRLGFSEEYLNGCAGIGVLLNLNIDHKLSSKTVDWLRTVQHNQDAHIAWAKCINLADTKCPSIAKEDNVSAS